MKITYPCAIFAGGKSRRMGEDKTLLSFGGESSLVAYQHKKFSALCDDVVVVTKGGKFQETSWEIITDSSEIFSPMVGLVSLFEKCDAQKILVIAADTPFVTLQTLQTLCQSVRHEDDVTVLQTGEKIHPMCAVYDKRVIKGLKECIQEEKYKLTLFLESVATHYVVCGTLEELANLNTPEEYKLANERINGWN